MTTEIVLHTAPGLGLELEPSPLLPVLLAPSQQAAMVYLRSLGEGSRRGTWTSLQRIAAVLTGGACDAQTLPWGRVTFAHTAGMASHLRDCCGRAENPMALGTARKILAALRGVLKTAWRLGQMGAEQLARALDFRGVKLDSGAVTGRALTKEEVGALFAVCNADTRPVGVRDRALLAVCVFTGMRRAELVNLDVADIDAGRRSILVRRGKGGKSREIPLGGGWDSLEAWLVVRGREPGPLFLPMVGPRSSEFSARRLNDRAVYEILAQLARRAGVASFTPHDLRRTLATNLFMKGANVASIQKMLGHENIQTTARYDRSGIEAMESASALLDYDVNAEVAP